MDSACIQLFGIYILFVTSVLTSTVDVTIPSVKANESLGGFGTTDLNEAHASNIDTGLKHHKVLCSVAMFNSSANFFKYTVETWNPNFVILRLYFHGDFINSATPDIILPYHWFWTYYSPDGYFPYLKWPVDFSVLSFGLLGVRTYPDPIPINLTVNPPNCSLHLGQPNTTYAIAEAFRNLTQDYLAQINPRSYSYSYWCYLAERPGERNSWDYFLGVNFGYITDFGGYKCCRTDVEKDKDNDNLRISCLSKQVQKTFQTTGIPYLIGLVIFAYFPVVIVKVASKIEKNNQSLNDNKWVFLSGRSSLNFSILACSLCGLSKRHPVFISRLQRLFLILSLPSVIYVQLLVYRKHEHIKAFIHHGMPLSYISMLDGFHASRRHFLPYLGGPFILLAAFFVGCFVFVLVPKSLDKTLDYGISAEHNGNYSSNFYPLTFCDEIIEKQSGISLCKYYGYARLARRCDAGLAMIINPQFWKFLNAIQRERFFFSRQFIITRMQRLPYWLSAFTLFIFSCVYILICLKELLFCILYYGIPLLYFIKHVIQSNVKCILQWLEPRIQGEANNQHPRAFKILKAAIAVPVVIVMIYFVISACTIFCVSLSFLAMVTVFTFLAVVVYPAYSFGFVFFGLAFAYYFFKRLQSFGEVYTELLHDAVEISCRLQEVELHTRLIDGTLLVESTQSENISRFQLNDRMVELTDEQKRIINTPHIRESKDRVAKIYYKNEKLGIPRELYQLLVQKYRPVHIQVAKSLLRLILILTLIILTLSVVLQGSYQQKAAMSEVVHVIFIVAIGALPRILELAFATMNFSVKKEIELRKITKTIEQYWHDREFSNMQLL